MGAATAQKFLFDRSFDKPAPPRDPNQGTAADGKTRPDDVRQDNSGASSAQNGSKNQKPAEPETPPEPEKIYTQDDLEAAKEQGYIDGHTAALEDAETSREHYVADALNLMSKGLSDLDQKQRDSNEDITRTALRMVFAVAQKVFPATSSKLVVEEVEGMVRDILERLRTEPKLVIRVHPMIADEVEQRIADTVAASKFEGKVQVLSDSELQPGDCRLEWDGGGAERSEARIWSDLEEVISHTIGHVDLVVLDMEAESLKPAEAEKYVPGLRSQDEGAEDAEAGETDTRQTDADSSDAEPLVVGATDDVDTDQQDEPSDSEGPSASDGEDNV